MVGHHWFFGSFGSSDIEIVQVGNAGQTSGASITVSLPGSITAGNRVIIVVGIKGSEDPIATSIAGAFSTTWELVLGSNATQNNASVEHWISDVLVGTETGSIQVNLSNSSDDCCVMAIEVKNIMTAPAWLTAPQKATSTAGGSTISMSSITATANSLMLGAGAMQNDGSDFSSASNGYELVDSDVHSNAGGGGSNSVTLATTSLIAAGGAISSVTTMDASNNNSGSHVEYLQKDAATSGSGMAPVQNAQNIVQNAGDSITVSLPATTIAANTLIAYVARAGTASDAASSLTSAHGTWSKISGSEGSRTGATSEMWSVQDISASAGAITVNNNSSGESLGVIVIELSGGVTSGGPTLAAGGANGSSTTSTTATVDPSGADTLAIAGHAAGAGGATFSSPTNSYFIVSQQQSAGGGSHISMAMVIAEKSASTNTAITLSGSVEWANSIVLMDPA